MLHPRDATVQASDTYPDRKVSPVAQTTLRLRTEVFDNLRRAAGLSTTAVADRIGCDRSTIYRARHGSEPSSAFIAGVTLTFGTAFEDLFEAVEVAA